MTIVIVIRIMSYYIYSNPKERIIFFLEVSSAAL